MGNSHLRPIETLLRSVSALTVNAIEEAVDAGDVSLIGRLEKLNTAIKAELSNVRAEITKEFKG